MLPAKLVRWCGRACSRDGPRAFGPGGNKLDDSFALWRSELQEFKTMPDRGTVLGERADMQGRSVRRQRKLQFDYLFRRAQAGEGGAQPTLANVYDSPGYEFSGAQRNQHGRVQSNALMSAFRLPLTRTRSLRAVIRHI
ncbi:MAG TPA: hypothetical protein VJN48_04580 [Terriglobales bacterium]|nr:hypothetical protein [Terriglobales bacterium]